VYFVELGVAERVMFLGKVVKGVRFLKAFYYFVFPSSLEGFGLALVEAIAAKIPVIYSNIKVIQSLIINHSYQSPVGNVGLLTHKMVKADSVGYKKNEEIALEQYSFAKNNFDLMSNMEKYRNLFSRLMLGGIE
tara:strand:- start:45557 stop:45958 length:402 start_codon:yes stop_codon:yes gene_type:complete